MSGGFLGGDGGYVVRLARTDGSIYDSTIYDSTSYDSTSYDSTRASEADNRSGPVRARHRAGSSAALRPDSVNNAGSMTLRPGATGTSNGICASTSRLTSVPGAISVSTRPPSARSRTQRSV